MSKYIEIYDVNLIKSMLNKNYLHYGKHYTVLTPNEMKQRLLREYPKFKKYEFKFDSDRLWVSSEAPKSDLKIMFMFTDTVAFDVASDN